MIADAWLTNQAGLAFDTIAEDYDASFTQSHIGRAQRSVVWREADKVFRRPSSLLELNCGTGEDALFLASRGHRITALDASHAMIERATSRKMIEAPDAAIEFRLLPTEQLSTLPPVRFDGIFSNFSGLNCVEDLRDVATELARRTSPGASALLCISTRVCMWETAWFLLQGKFSKAFRRWSGHSKAMLNGINVVVHYPTIAEFSEALGPYFKLNTWSGVGIVVPPSYVEPWMRTRPRLLAFMASIDRVISRLPILRSIGDHVLLHFERTAEEPR